MSRTPRYGPFSGPGMRREVTHSRASEGLPPIEQFVDELPPIADFLLTEPGVADSSVADAVSPQEVLPQEAAFEYPTPDEEGWAKGKWQSYDWGSLSSLSGDMAEQDTASVWGDTEWPSRDEGEPATRAANPEPADEIAAALEGMARRIRSGELVIDRLEGTPPEAAMAAALATILRMRG